MSYCVFSYGFSFIRFNKDIDYHVILYILSYIHIAGAEFVIPGKLHND